MRALIFGAGGQVGRAMASTAPVDAEIVALTRAQCDISSRSQVARAIAAAAPDIVFNAAAYTAVDRAESEEAQAEAINALAPGLIAQEARAAGSRIVHISTDYVFDGSATRPYRPEDPVAPQSVYGRTKLAGERAVAAADPEALTVRTSWVYTAHGSNFVNTMLRLMREREQIGVVADQIGAPTHAESLAAALWKLALAGATGVLHYRDAEAASWYDFAVAIQAEAHAIGLLERRIPIAPIATSDYSTPAPRPGYSVLDASEAWRIIGGPPPPWQENLRATLKEVRDYG